MNFPLSKRHKTAQFYFHKSAKDTADAIATVIRTFATYIQPENELSFRDAVRNKIRDINPAEVSQKEMPPSARIGQAISVVKGFLNGQDELFVVQTLNELVGKI